MKKLLLLALAAFSFAACDKSMMADKNIDTKSASATEMVTITLRYDKNSASIGEQTDMTLEGADNNPMFIDSFTNDGEEISYQVPKGSKQRVNILAVVTTTDFVGVKLNHAFLVELWEGQNYNYNFTADNNTILTFSFIN